MPAYAAGRRAPTTSTSSSSPCRPRRSPRSSPRRRRGGVHGLVVVSARVRRGRRRRAASSRATGRAARGAGMRVVGPELASGSSTPTRRCRLNASLRTAMPAAGPGRLLLPVRRARRRAARRRGRSAALGVSSFVSAGNRADVSGNDLMQYWEDDPSTDAVMLYLETIGNPRKFTPGRPAAVPPQAGGRREVRPGAHARRAARSPGARVDAPAAAVDALFRACRGDPGRARSTEMFDVGALVAHQPLPAGGAVAIVEQLRRAGGAARPTRSRRAGPARRRVARRAARGRVRAGVRDGDGRRRRGPGGGRGPRRPPPVRRHRRDGPRGPDPRRGRRGTTAVAAVPAGSRGGPRPAQRRAGVRTRVRHGRGGGHSDRGCRAVRGVAPGPAEPAAGAARPARRGGDELLGRLVAGLPPAGTGAAECGCGRRSRGTSVAPCWRRTASGSGPRSSSRRRRRPSRPRAGSATPSP